jgi:hypothetical protein
VGLKYQGKVFAFDKSPEDVRRDVGAYHPRYVCFVCQPTENFPSHATGDSGFAALLFVSRSKSRSEHQGVTAAVRQNSRER